MENILICTYDSELLPEKKTPEAMCWDIKSAEAFSIAPGEIKLVKSWIKTFIPHGRACKIYVRSSLPIKNGLMLANSVGIVDADYRGEHLMQLYNFIGKTLDIPQYARLCQIEFCPHHWGEKNFWTSKIPAIEMKVDNQLFDTFDKVFCSERGAWGFGSTGSK